MNRYVFRSPRLGFLAADPALAAPAAAFYRRNRDAFAPFDPVQPEDFFTEAGQAERLADELLEGRSKARRRPTPLIRDVRLFINTVNHALDTMRRSGIPAQAEKSETPEYIQYVVRIPKGGKTVAEVTGIHTA